MVESARAPNPTYTADFPSSQTDLTRNIRESAGPESSAETTATGRNDVNNDDSVDPESPQVSETFEIIKTPHLQYLCSVPVIAPPPVLNQTATELAKAEEARELSRASAKGWELMRGLEGTCLYYMSGWWSYSFCYGKESKEVVQYHPLPQLKNGLPERDPETAEYVLGTTNIERTNPGARRKQQGPGAGQGAGSENTPAMGKGATEDGAKAVSQQPKTDLQIKGDQRYLVQKFEHGTICDLTGRPRTIEVQYHCSPGTTADRIGWIKEVTTCTYLMLVQTPRLCADVAFIPPKETRAHPISCRQIVSSDEELDAWRDRKTIEAARSMALADAQRARLLEDPSGAGVEKVTSIGGIVIGGRKILGTAGEDGKPPAKIKPPGHIAAAAAAAAKTALSPLLEAVKKGTTGGTGGGDKKTGGEGNGLGEPKKVQILTADELDQLPLDAESLEEFKNELKRLAQDKGLFMVEHYDPEGEDEDGGEENGNTKKTGAKQGGNGNRKGSNGKIGREGEEEEVEGSEEVFFKEEL